MADLLAARSDRAVHLESDRFFRFIRSGYIEPWKPASHEQNATVMRIVAGAAAGYAEAGYFTIVDGIIIPRWFLEPLAGSLRAAGHAVAYAVLRAPLSVCLSRAGSRGSDRLADDSVIERLWGQFAELGSLEAHVVDTAARNADETVDVLAGRLLAGSLAI